MGGISGLAEGLAGAGAGMAQGMQEGVKLGLAMRQAEQNRELSEAQLRKLRLENAALSYQAGGLGGIAEAADAMQPAPVVGGPAGVQQSIQGGGAAAQQFAGGPAGVQQALAAAPTAPIEDQPTSAPDVQGWDTIRTVYPQDARRIQGIYNAAVDVLNDPNATAIMREEAQMHLGLARKEAQGLMQGPETLEYIDGQRRSEIERIAQEIGRGLPKDLSELEGRELADELAVYEQAQEDAWRNDYLRKKTLEHAIALAADKDLSDEAQKVMAAIQRGPAVAMSRAERQAFYESNLRALAIETSGKLEAEAWGEKLAQVEAAHKKTLTELRNLQTNRDNILRDLDPYVMEDGRFDLERLYVENPVFVADRLHDLGLVPERTRTVIEQNVRLVQGMLEGKIAPPENLTMAEEERWWSAAIGEYLNNATDAEGNPLGIGALKEQDLKPLLDAAVATQKQEREQKGEWATVGDEAPWDHFFMDHARGRLDRAKNAGYRATKDPGKDASGKQQVEYASANISALGYAKARLNKGNKGRVQAQIDDYESRLREIMVRPNTPSPLKADIARYLGISQPSEEKPKGKEPAEEGTTSGQLGGIRNAPLGVEEPGGPALSGITTALAYGDMQAEDALMGTADEALTRQAMEALKQRRREDGTLKGPGWLGSMPMSDGSDQVATELSITVGASDVGQSGEDVLIPLLVPTLTRGEVEHLTDGKEATDAIVKKAIAHARKQIKAGKSPFKQ